MLIGAIGGLWAALLSMAGVVHYLYRSRTAEKDARIAVLEQSITEKDAKYEKREQEYISELRTTIQTLSTSQANVTKQNDFIESVMISLLGRDMGEAESPKALPNRRSS